MPPERKSRTAATSKSAGTFDEMYSPTVKPAPSAWSRPRPVELEEEVEEDISGELSPVVERDYNTAMVEKVYDALDYVVPTLGKTNDQAIYMMMVRRSFGRGQKTCLVNLPLYAERTNLSISGVQYAIRRLRGLKLIKEVGQRFGRNQDQGVEYEVKVPANR